MARKNKKNEPITLDKEAEDVYADELAKKNGTTVEHEKALNRAAMARDDNESTNDNITSSVATPGSMVVNGIDVSLPYDEYVAEFHKKYPRAQPMSKYSYELAQGKAKEANVDDTKAIGATKEELDYMLQNGQISRDAYDKQIAALQTPEAQEEMIRGEKKADENVWDSSNREVPGSTSANNALTDSVSEAVTPKKDDPPEVVSDKNKYNKAMMSIWDAYRAGEISKETAGYFTIDAIATLAKNLGRSIGNVGAQFSGGTIDNGHDDSKWGQRQDALLNEEIGMETESLGGAAGRQAQSETLDLEAKKIRNAYTPAQLEQQIEMFKKDLEMADINLDMAHSRTDLINFIKNDPNYAKSPFKMGLVAYLTQAGVSGATNSTAKTLGDAINWIMTIAK